MRTKSKDNNKKKTERINSKDMKKNIIQVKGKTSHNDIYKMTGQQNIINKLHIKFRQFSKNKSKQKERIQKKNPIKKLDYSISNTYYLNNNTFSLDFNKINHHIMNSTDFNLKEKIEKYKLLHASNNYNYAMNITDIERLKTLNIDNNHAYNRLIKNRNSISILNRDYLINKGKNKKLYGSINKSKQNININNNIIININNKQNEAQANLNKTLTSNKAKEKSKIKNNNYNSHIKNGSKIKLIKQTKQINNNFNKNNQNKNHDFSPKKYINIDKIKNTNQIPKDYLNIIYYNLLQEEHKGIKPMVIYNYMVDQNEINEQMRSILIDWLTDVHHKFQFRDETLFMTVLIIDRYCTIRQISRNKLQLLGVTSMMIASKHEEIDFPKIEDFIYITDNAYTKEEIVKLEFDILIALNFELLYPSPIKFFEYLSVNFNFDKKAHCMGKYLMESFLVDIKYVKYKASVISCACAYIVMKFFKIEGYHESYSKKYFMVNENEDLPVGHGVKDCAQDICILVDNIKNSNYLSCFKKYSKDEFEKVALLIENKN